MTTLELRTIQDAKRFLTAQFRGAGIESADIDARLLLMHATGLSRSDLIAFDQNVLSSDIIKTIQNLAARRIGGEPVDHILGRREFYGREFKVTQDVLSPRPETEMLVEAALDIIASNPAAHILDLGTGSGAILISILAQAEQASGTAIDISEAALDIAKENAKTRDVDARIEFGLGAWFEPIKARYDIIISNPPYITKPAMETLSAEVKNFDPHLALSGGDDGLEAYREIISKAKKFLKPKGQVILEIGFDQRASVEDLLKEAGFSKVTTTKDLAGYDRMVCAALTF